MVVRVHAAPNLMLKQRHVCNIIIDTVLLSYDYTPYSVSNLDLFIRRIQFVWRRNYSK